MGANVINVDVIAVDATPTKRYTITVTRESAGSSDNTLSALAVVGPAAPVLTPTFAAGTTVYTMVVANTDATATLQATVNDVGKATVVVSPAGSTALVVVRTRVLWSHAPTTRHS